MSRAKIAIVAAVILLAAVLAAWTFSTPPNTIVLKKDGFHPRTLTVPAGTKITFRNESGKYFWPASDFHPTHTLFPAFDAKEPIKSGDSWSFAFADPGTYPFHDHLAAYFTGIIRVKGEDGAVPDNCLERGGNFACWQNQIFLALSEHGLDAAYDVLTNLYDTDDTFAGSCHTITHNLGLASYQFYLRDPSTVLSPKAVACGAGFYHGFMEGLFGASGDAKKAAAVCDKIGDALKDESPDARLQCFHGIGHGAMETAVASTGAFTNIDDMAQAAVETCEAASEGVDERYRCVSGAYNSLANLYVTKSYGLSIDKADPFAMCSRQKDPYKEGCYGNMNSLAFWLGGNDFTKAAPYILSIPDIGDRPKAIEYLSGMNAIPHVHDQSFAGIVPACRALPSAYDLPCIRGFAHGLLEHGSPGKEYEQALAFCRTGALSDTERDACYTEAIGHLDGWYSAPRILEICASVDASLQRYCKK